MIRNVFSDSFTSSDPADRFGLGRGDRILHSVPDRAHISPLSSTAAAPTLLASLPYFGSAHNIFEVSDSCWQA